MGKVSKSPNRASPPPQLGLKLPKPTTPYPAWLWPFVRAYERHRGVPKVREIYKAILTVRGILRPHETWFDIFAVWLYFLRDLDVPLHRSLPSVYSFGHDFRVYWQEAWCGHQNENLNQEQKQRLAIQRLLTEDTEPPWIYEDLLRAFRD